MTLAPARSGPSPRRGRPPRFSREQIVSAVADMLLADPETPLTIARAAEAVGAAPMSLYRHFADRDDLVSAVARHVFADARPRVADGTAWQEAVRAWMLTVHRTASRVPQLVQLMARGEAPEWLADSSYLAAALERAGVRDDRVLAEGVYWVATTTMGHAMISATPRSENAVELRGAGIERLDPEDAARNARLIPHFDAMQEDAFDRVVTWTIAGLEAMLA
jgi:AcrR family transcriptional regulator